MKKSIHISEQPTNHENKCINELNYKLGMGNHEILILQQYNTIVIALL